MCNHLVSSRVVTGVQSDETVPNVAKGVEAEVPSSDEAEAEVVRDLQFLVDVVQVPLERLALKILLETHPLADAASHE